MRCPACGISGLQSLIPVLMKSTAFATMPIMDQADVNLVLNGGTHYSTGGKWLPVPLLVVTCIVFQSYRPVA